MYIKRQHFLCFHLVTHLRFYNKNMKLQIVLFLFLFGQTFAQSPKFSNHCQTCQSIIEKIELNDQIKCLDQYVDKLTYVGQNVCNFTILNQDFADKCNEFVEEIPKMIKYLTNLNVTLNYEVFCQHLGFCDVNNLNQPFFQIEHQPKVGSDPYYLRHPCDVCDHFVIDKIQETLEDHADDINDHYLEVHFAFMAICNSEVLNHFLGQNFTDRCNTFSKDFPNLITYWINENHDFSSKDVCVNLGFCRP